MFPINEKSRKEITNAKKKMKCVDRENLTIWGDYNSPVAQEFAIKFKMCVGEGCEPIEKIRDWLSGKFIVL